MSDKKSLLQWVLLAFVVIVLSAVTVNEIATQAKIEQLSLAVSMVRSQTAGLQGQVSTLQEWYDSQHEAYHNVNGMGQDMGKPEPVIVNPSSVTAPQYRDCVLGVTEGGPTRDQLLCIDQTGKTVVVLDSIQDAFGIEFYQGVLAVVQPPGSQVVYVQFAKEASVTDFSFSTYNLTTKQAGSVYTWAPEIAKANIQFGPGWSTFLSPDSSYIVLAEVDEEFTENSDVRVLYVYDLKKQKLLMTVIPKSTESLLKSRDNFAWEADVQWISANTFKYGVYTVPTKDAFPYKGKILRYETVTVSQ